jgi:proliferating cell nuclear antigen
MDNTIISSGTEENVLEIKTVQVSVFKLLCTALKDILIENNIKFKKPDDTGAGGAIIISSMDQTHMVLAHMCLDSENFEHFYCKYPSIIIGVNMVHLFKIINTIESNDTLTIYITAEDYNHGNIKYLSFKFQNGEINQCRTYKLRLIDPLEDDSDIPANVKYSSIITLPSTDFQKIIRDLSSFSDRLEIRCVGDELIFALVGPYATVEIKRSESEHNMNFTQKDDPVFVHQGFYSLKYLSYVIKCSNLCSSCELYLSNGLPLIVSYNVASLGELKLCLASLSSQTPKK